MISLPVLCLLTLIAAGLFNTLLRSARSSGEAGLSRLVEKKPKLAKLQNRWERRWPELINLLTLLAVCSQIATIWSAVVLFEETFTATEPLGFLAVGMFTLFNLTVTRTLPGVLTEHYADRITLSFLPVGFLLFWIFYPLVWLISSLERILHLRLAGNNEEGNRPTAEDEILTLVDQTNDHDLDDDEREFIRSALEFGETITREIMTPRVRMQGLEDTLHVADALEIVKDSPYSRFPLYHEDFDEILGMIHVKSLLRAIAEGRTDSPLAEHIHPATFVPESMLINDLLRLMKQNKVHTAIAVDEYGGTAGVVTLEDILEELVGEIEDEHDRESKPYQQIGEGAYQVEASMPLDELNEELGLKLPEREEYDSVAGYLLYTLGRIPNAGEVLQAPGCEIRIQTATARRIQTIILRPRPETDEEGKG